MENDIQHTNHSAYRCLYHIVFAPKYRIRIIYGEIKEDKRAFIVTQSIKKLNKEDKAWALDTKGFTRLSDGKVVDIADISDDDTEIYYKDEPYTPRNIHQRLIITYSPKYARYQKAIRDKQVERAKAMLDSGKVKKERKNPNDPARFISKLTTTEDGEIVKTESYFDDDKVEEEAKYDGLYGIATDLLDDDVKDILKVTEGRWEIEECFRIMKTDFEARPVYLHNETRIKAHFLTCFLALAIYRFIERDLGSRYTCSSILNTLRNMNFADIHGQGFMPVYERTEITDDLHNLCGFNTDFEIITKKDMKKIQKLSKNRT